MKPLDPSADGRDTLGRVTVGNKNGRGNPHTQKVARLRSALLNAVSEEDIEAIIKKLVQDARAGDLYAAREVLVQVLGKPVEYDIIERLEALEGLLDGAVSQRA